MQNPLRSRSTSLPLLLALSIMLCRPTPPASAQATRTYAPPTPQHYQEKHVPKPREEYLEELHSQPTVPVQPGAAPPSSYGPAAPQSAEKSTDLLSLADLLDSIFNNVVDFIRQHMMASFLCMVLLAPFWAMSGMKRAKHPYEERDE